MRATITLLVLAAALSAAGTEVGLERYLRSDAIARVRVTAVNGLDVTGDVLSILHGDAPVGRHITIRQGSLAILSPGDDFILFLVHRDVWHVLAATSTCLTVVEGLRQTIATLPAWSPRGAISVISYCERCDWEIPAGNSRPTIGISIGYRNDTDVPLMAGGTRIEPHDVVLKQVAVPTPMPDRLTTMTIPFDDGTYAFDPVRITVTPGSSRARP